MKKEKERERWTAIDFEYMTEESDGEEQVRQHKLPWRSEGRLVVFAVSAVLYIPTNGFSVLYSAESSCEKVRCKDREEREGWGF